MTDHVGTRFLQEPHPPRMTEESAARRQARMDPSPPNLFEQLDKLRPFVEVRSVGQRIYTELIAKESVLNDQLQHSL